MIFMAVGRRTVTPGIAIRFWFRPDEGFWKVWFKNGRYDREICLDEEDTQ
jgi:hypothetical protein